MDKLPGICQMQNGLSLSFISPSCKGGDDEAGLTGKRAGIRVLVRVDLGSEPDRIWDQLRGMDLGVSGGIIWKHCGGGAILSQSGQRLSGAQL